MLRIAALSLFVASAGAMELTSATWDSATAGKSVFVKFQAPWWGHCKSMKPDWDTLMDEFKDSSTSLVADVDCTSDGGKDLCTKVGVTGYPTIKYGDPADLKKYEGGRKLEDLRTFAKENLGPQCGVDNIDLCDDESKATIAKFQAMTPEELEKAIGDFDAAKTKIEDSHNKATDKLEKQIEDLSSKATKETKKKEDAVAKLIKKSGLSMMKAVASQKKKDEM